MSTASRQPPIETPPQKPRRRWLAALKLGIVALVLWGIHRKIGAGLDDLRATAWSAKNLHWGGLAGAALLYLMGLVPAGLFWRQLLVRLGQRPGWFETLRAYFIGHLGKYVPGKALVVILRAGLIRSDRVDMGVAAAAVFAETLTMMAVGALLGGSVVLVLFREHWQLALLAIGLMLGAGVPTIPPVFVALARLAKVGRGKPELAERLAHLNYGTLILGWIGNLVGWFFVGLSLLLVVHSAGFGHSDRTFLEWWYICTGAAALATVAGFASLIPGGLFVRDAVLMVLLAPTLGQAGALVATIVARLVWLVAEVAISIILYPLGRSPAEVVAPPV